MFIVFSISGCYLNKYLLKTFRSMRNKKIPEFVYYVDAVYEHSLKIDKGDILMNYSNCYLRFRTIDLKKLWSWTN